MMPAMKPMMTAPSEFTNAQGAVMATRPASRPLQSIVGSGLPVTRYIVSSVPTDAAAPASIVFTATMAMRLSVPASVEPGLNPNQPNARMNVPSMTIGMSWPGIARGFPSLPYLPRRGPIHHAPARQIMPPHMCTTPEPAKSTAPWPRPKF